MLNEKGERELAYLVKIDDIVPIEGANNVETALVGGWHIMVHKNEFQIGDIAVYFEIDSRVPEEEPFMFLANKHFKIKTQKYFHGTVISQGLLISLNDFIIDGKEPTWVTDTKDRIAKGIDVEHTFLTKELKVRYSVEEDNERKGKNPTTSKVNKYSRMMKRKPRLFAHTWAQKMMEHSASKNIMFFFFGNKADKKISHWPEWVTVTDEERIQNMPDILTHQDNSWWIATEKIDGTSTTATYKRINKHKHEFYICSRHVVFDKPDTNCFYDTNVYIEMAEKYHFEEVLGEIANKYNLEWVTLQGETYGAGIQKNNYDLTGHNFAGFNLIFSDCGRLNPLKSKSIMKDYLIPWVPIVDPDFKLPHDMDTILALAEGDSQINGKMREGLVIRNMDGIRSFKVVSNSYLLKYHQ